MRRTPSEQAGLIEAAARKYGDFGDWSSLSTLVHQQADFLLNHGKSDLLEDCLSKLPPELVEQDPWVLFWLGSCKMTGNFAEARTFFQKAFPLFEAARDPAGIYLTWSGAVDSILYEWSDFIRLDIWIDRLQALMEHYPDFPDREIEGRVANSMFGALMFHLPQHPHISGWAERIVSLTRASNDAAYRIMVGNQLAIYHILLTGDHKKLGQIMDLLRPPEEGESLPPLAHIIWISLRGFQEWISGFPLKGQTTFQEGLRIAKRSGVHVWDFMLYIQGIVSYLGEGEYRTAKKYLDEIITRVDRTQHMNIAHYYYVAAWQAVLAGEPSRAFEHAQTAIKTAELLGGPFTHATIYSALAQTQYLTGDTVGAFASADKSIVMARSINTNLLLYRNLMVKAFFELDNGNEEACVNLLRQALPIGSAGGYMNFSWWNKSMMTKLCLKALEAGIETGYVREVIIRRHLVPDEPPLLVENWPWPIRIYTLGRFELRKNDTLVIFSGKVQKKPLELLKVIIALGAKNVAGEAICDVLWPDAEGDTAATALATTLCRLRQLLGCDHALQFQNGYLSLNRRYVWLDVWAFERAIGEARQMWELTDGGIGQTLEQTEKARALYGGEFLPAERNHPWSFTLRERLKQKFVFKMESLCSYLEQCGEMKRAIRCYHDALEIDNLSEAFYQQLMQCLHRDGRRAEALKIYERCRMTMAHSLSVAPSRKTEELFHQIKNS